MNILCTASETTIDVLQLVQSLASGSAKQHYLDKSQKPPVNQPSSSTKYSRECLIKHSAVVTPTDTKQEFAVELKKGTRFTLPSSAKKRFLPDGKRRSRQIYNEKPESNKKSVKTLNILGMQPNFSESLMGSIGQTMTHTGAIDSDASANTQCKGDDPANQQNQFNKWSSTNLLLQSVRTQSLIENESIPETLPSQYSSNTTVLDLGSSTTLEAATPHSKSNGLLACSIGFSKNMNSSLLNVHSNAIVSSNPSEDIAALGEEHDTSVSSLIPVQRILISPLSGLLADYGQSTKHDNEELPTLHENAFLESSQPNAQSKSTHQVTSNQYQGIVSQCSHYTHSTVHLSGDAGVPGSQVYPSTIYRRSTHSTELPNINSTIALRNSSKFENWPNEVALVYTLNMASVVMFGRSSLIQRVALEGPEHKSVKKKLLSPVEKYGLIQLIDFNPRSGSKSDPTRCGKFN